MLEVIRKKDFSSSMLKHAIFFILFFPMITSKANIAYSPDIMLVSGFVALFLLGMIVQGAVHFPREKRLGIILLALIVLLNVFLSYINVTSQHWYWGQINLTLSLLMFWMLLGRKEEALQSDESVVRFLLQAIVVSTLIGFVFYAKGILEVQLLYGQIELLPTTHEHGGNERRFHWIYYHKSQYALMLILFLSVIISNRRLFLKRWLYIASIGVILVGLFIANMRSSVVVSTFIFLGMAADTLIKRFGRVPRKALWLLVPVAFVFAGMFFVIGKDRNWLTLNERVYIWPASISYLKENFWGVGNWAGRTGFVWDAIKNRGSNNCHNVFLNWMLQYSVPGGLCITAMVVAVFIAAIRRNPGYTTISIILALLIPMMMDWCVLPSDMPMLMLGLYFTFFSPTGQAGLKALREEACSQ